MTAWFAAAFMVIGAVFMLIAAIGVWRFPDVFTRMQAATKAGTLGVGCLAISVAIHFAELAVTVNVALIALFFFLTSPVAAHRIGRAAHRIGVPLWEGTLRDELREVPGAPVIEEDTGSAPAPGDQDEPPSLPPGGTG
jgi:multicomponent Na+:H+ antiporter subunit G